MLKKLVGLSASSLVSFAAGADVTFGCWEFPDLPDFRGHVVGQRLHIDLGGESSGCTGIASRSFVYVGYIGVVTGTDCDPPFGTGSAIFGYSDGRNDPQPESPSSDAELWIGDVESGPGVGAHALTRDFGSDPEIELCATHVLPKSVECSEENRVETTWVAATVSVTGAVFVFECEEPPEITLTAQFGVTAPVVYTGSIADFIGLGPSVNYGPFGVIVRGPGRVLEIGPGTFVGSSGDRTYSDTVAVPVGAETVDATHLTFTDSLLDLDNDARFSSADVALLAALVSSSAAGYEDFDFNKNNVIDARDVEILSALAEGGFASGLLGDIDLDGDLDCDDVAIVQTFPDSVIGDLDYYVAADADLDGDNDVNDQEAVWTALLVVQPADVVLDGVVDILDFLDFLDAFGTCENMSGPCYASGGSVNADFNGDTTVDILDLLDFTDAYGNACP